MFEIFENLLGEDMDFDNGGEGFDNDVIDVEDNEFLDLDYHITEFDETPDLDDGGIDIVDGGIDIDDDEIDFDDDDSSGYDDTSIEIDDDIDDFDDATPDLEIDPNDLDFDEIPDYDSSGFDHDVPSDFESGDYSPSFGGLANTLQDVAQKALRPGIISDITNLINDKVDDLFSNDDDGDYSYLND
jgi:hypothetical protein